MKSDLYQIPCPASVASALSVCFTVMLQWTECSTHKLITYGESLLDNFTESAWKSGWLTSLGWSSKMMLIGTYIFMKWCHEFNKLFQELTHSVSETKVKRAAEMPYDLSWDVLWFERCGDSFSFTPMIHFNDDTVSPWSWIKTWNKTCCPYQMKHKQCITLLIQCALLLMW